MRQVSQRYNRKEGEELDKIIYESYDDFVRLERRNLLITSSVILLSCISGLNPTKGTIFGFSIDGLTEKTYYLALAAVVLYFLSAFIIYGFPSYKRALILRKQIIEDSMTLTEFDKLISFNLHTVFNNVRYYSWAFLHFILPTLLGAVSLLIAVIVVA